MRALVLAAFAVAAACDRDAAMVPPPAPRAQAAVAARARDQCRDACDQNAILAPAGDDALRACRAGCDGKYGGAATAHEVPSRITVAPAVHRPPAVRPR